MERRNIGLAWAITRLVVVLVLSLSATAAFADPIVYSQSAQSPVVSTRASQTQGALGLVFQTFDSFSLIEDMLITGFDWQGSYFNALVADNTLNPPPNATGFNVALYSDSAGTPGALLASQTFSPAAAGQTFVGQQAFGATSIGLGIYDYSATLSSAFHASAGTTYWLSIVANSLLASPTEAQWGWNGGTGGDGTSQQAALPGAPVTVNFDRAFGVRASIPEPSSLLLLGSGLAGLAVARRRRKA